MAVPPDPVVNVTVTATTPYSASVSWAPGSDGFGPITGYNVTVVALSAPFASTTVFAHVSAANVTGLLAATTYNVTIVAVNIAGAGPSTTLSAVTSGNVAAVQVQLACVVRPTCLLTHACTLCVYRAVHSRNAPRPTVWRRSDALHRPAGASALDTVHQHGCDSHG